MTIYILEGLSVLAVVWVAFWGTAWVPVSVRAMEPEYARPALADNHYLRADKMYEPLGDCVTLRRRWLGHSTRRAFVVSRGTPADYWADTGELAYGRPRRAANRAVREYHEATKAAKRVESYHKDEEKARVRLQRELLALGVGTDTEEGVS